MRHLICAVLLCLSSASALAVIDLNSASAGELDGLPGIGPGRAQAIVDYRQAHGPFTSVDDLGKVKGIGDKTLAEVRPLVTVAPPAGAVAEPAPMPVQVPPVAASPSSNSAPAPSAFPWGWLAVGTLVAAVVAFLALRRRPATVAAPSAEAAPELKPAAASPAPRPAGGDAHASVPPARPAGAPPRPAGRAPMPATQDADPEPTPAAPKPAGAPPRPAGSR
jgi:competence protein ComEA